MTITAETTTRTPEERKTVQPPRTRRRRGPVPGRKNSPWIGLLAWGVGLLFIVPVAWMVLTSLHSETDAAANPPKLFAPLTLAHYSKVFGLTGDQSAVPALLNSAMAAIASTLLVLLLAIPAAYATSIRPVRKPADVMFFFLSTKFLPIAAGLLPIYLAAKNLGLLDNIGFLTLLYTAMNLPIAVWTIRSFLLEVPTEIIEAAQIDGAGLLRTLRYVILPVASPGIAATSLICVIFSWNELLLARTVTGTLAGTSPVFLSGFVTSQGLFLAQLCAACLVVSLPILIAGFAAQNRLVQGLSLGAVK